MRLITVLTLILLCGCGKATTDQQARVEAEPKGDATSTDSKSTSLVVIEGKVTGGGVGDKYYWYEIQPRKVLKNSTKSKLGKSLNVAIENDRPQIKVGEIYIAELNYYNPSNPEYGFRIVSFRKK